MTGLRRGKPPAESRSGFPTERIFSTPAAYRVSLQEEHDPENLLALGRHGGCVTPQ
jgi:hypothetical protein